MNRPWVHAAGYLAIFIMPLLFVARAATANTWLAFGVVVLIFPLARLGCGALPGSGAPEWSEGMATWLDRLPLVYVPVLGVCILVGVASTVGAVPPVIVTGSEATLNANAGDHSPIVSSSLVSISVVVHWKTNS